MLVANREMNKHEKDKVRFKTIRYVERYCNIERQCQICGSKAEIHHPNYNEYLKINLLCKEHHRKLHNLELMQPKIIDLEKIAIKKQVKISKKQIVQNNIEKIKEDILKNGKTFYDITKQYKTSQGTIKKFLTDLEIKELSRISKENALQKIKIKKNLQKNI